MQQNLSFLGLVRVRYKILPGNVFASLVVSILPIPSSESSHDNINNNTTTTTTSAAVISSHSAPAYHLGLSQGLVVPPGNTRQMDQGDDSTTRQPPPPPSAAGGGGHANDTLVPPEQFTPGSFSRSADSSHGSSSTITNSSNQRLRYFLGMAAAQGPTSFCSEEDDDLSASSQHGPTLPE